MGALPAHGIALCSSCWRSFTSALARWTPCGYLRSAALRFSFFFSWDWELFPGSRENGLHSGIAISDGFLYVDPSPEAPPSSGRVNVFDRVAAVDVDPFKVPSFYNDSQMQEMGRRDFQFAVRDSGRVWLSGSAKEKGRLGSDPSTAETASTPSATLLQSFADNRRGVFGGWPLFQVRHWLFHVAPTGAENDKNGDAKLGELPGVYNTYHHAGKEPLEERSGRDTEGDAGRSGSLDGADGDDNEDGREAPPRKSERVLPKVLLPMAQYHTRLHTYILYTIYREVRAEQLRRLQVLWGELVMRPAPTAAKERTGEAEEEEEKSEEDIVAHRDFRRMHLEAELRQTRFAGLVQRTYMRALRHADAMRLESLHYLRLFALTVPALSEAWKGDDYCKWVGVTCHQIHIPLYRLLDERHGYLQAYSRDVYHRLPAQQRADIARRYDALLALGDAVNVNERIRDEASGFAQRVRDVMIRQTVSNLNSKRSRYVNENGDNFKEEAEEEKEGPCKRGGMSKEDGLKGGREARRKTAKRKTASDLSEAEREAAHTAAVALWYLLDDNATGTGLPSDTWTKAVWFEYHHGEEKGRGFAKEAVDTGTGEKARFLRALWPLSWWRRKEAAITTSRNKKMPKRAWMGPSPTLGNARVTEYGQQMFADEHAFPYMHRRFLSSLAMSPRVYYGSVEGPLSPRHLAARSTSTNGRASHDSDFVSPFTGPSSAPTNASKYGGNLFRPTATPANSADNAKPTPIVPSVAMNAALRELHEIFADTHFSQTAGKGRWEDVDTIPVTVFSLNVRDLGLAGFLPRRSEVRGELEDCDGWGDGDNCHGSMHDPADVVKGRLRRETRESPLQTAWWSPTVRAPSAFFPAEFVMSPPVEYHAENDDLLPAVPEDAKWSTYHSPRTPRLRTDLDGDSEDEVGDGKGERGGDASGADSEEKRTMRVYLETAAAAHGVTLSWEHVLQGEHARRRWLWEERCLKWLRSPEHKKAMYIVGPRASAYWGPELPISLLLSLRATVPGRGYTTATATDVAGHFRQILTRLEFHGAHTRHYDLAAYFGFVGSIGHFRGESENPFMPFSVLHHRGVHEKLSRWGLDLRNTIEDGFIYASRLVEPLRHIDDDITMGQLRPSLVPLVELDVSRNPAVGGVVPPHYFRFPFLRYVEVSETSVFFRIASKKYRSFINMLSHDVSDDNAKVPRSLIPFNSRFGNYYLKPVLPFVSRSFVDEFESAAGSHYPRQSGKQPPSFSVTSTAQLRRSGYSPPSEPHTKTAAPILLTRNNGDVRVTTGRTAETDANVTRLLSSLSAVTRLCTREGLSHLFGLGAPLF